LKKSIPQISTVADFDGVKAKNSASSTSSYDGFREDLPRVPIDASTMQNEIELNTIDNLNNDLAESPRVPIDVSTIQNDVELNYVEKSNSNSILNGNPHDLKNSSLFSNTPQISIKNKTVSPPPGFDAIPSKDLKCNKMKTFSSPIHKSNFELTTGEGNKNDCVLPSNILGSIGISSKSDGDSISEIQHPPPGFSLLSAPSDSSQLATEERFAYGHFGDSSLLFAPSKPMFPSFGISTYSNVIPDSVDNLHTLNPFVTQTGEREDSERRFNGSDVIYDKTNVSSLHKSGRTIIAKENARKRELALYSQSSEPDVSWNPFV